MDTVRFVAAEFEELVNSDVVIDGLAAFAAGVKARGRSLYTLTSSRDPRRLLSGLASRGVAVDGLITNRPRTLDGDRANHIPFGNCLRSISEGRFDGATILSLEVLPYDVPEGETLAKASVVHRMLRDLSMRAAGRNVEVEGSLLSKLLYPVVQDCFPSILNKCYRKRCKIALAILSGLNNGSVLARMLLNLTSIIKDTADIEVVVACNGSNDSTAELALGILKGWCPIKIVHYAENQGIAGGFNAAIDSTAADYICFMQDDIEIQETDFHRKLSDILDRYLEVGLVGGYGGAYCFHNAAYVSSGWGQKPFVTIPINKLLKPAPDEVYEVDTTLCHMMMYRRNLGCRFDLMLNPNGLEDIDFSMQVRNRNSKVCYTSIQMINKRVDGATRKNLNPIVTRIFHAYYFFQKNKDGLRHLDRDTFSGRVTPATLGLRINRLGTTNAVEPSAAVA